MKHKTRVLIVASLSALTMMIIFALVQRRSASTGSKCRDYFRPANRTAADSRSGGCAEAPDGKPAPSGKEEPSSGKPPTTKEPAAKEAESAGQEGILIPQNKVSELPAPVIALSSNNFESFVGRCFQGEPCEFADDPRDIYEVFKADGNRTGQDRLISFLRARMSNQIAREKYKDGLKLMIADFYPKEERPFQDATFYNYVGDLDRSLELYLDLEKRSKSDPSLRPAPPLNIANVFYDLGRPKEALPYFIAARSDFETGRTQTAVPSTNEMLRFIDNRIRKISETTENR